MLVCCAGELAGNVPWEVKRSSKMMTMIMMMTMTMVRMVLARMMMVRMMMVRMAIIARTTLLSGRRRGAAGAGADDELLRKGVKNLKINTIYYLCKITFKLRN